MKTLEEYLKKAIDDNASDVFFISGKAVCEKVNGDLEQVFDMDEILMPANTSDIVHQIYERAHRSFDGFDGDDDFSFAIPTLARFRVNAYSQRGSLAVVIRIVKFDIPDYKKMGIPDEVMNLSDLKHGMVLITGTAGTGKSTTMACIVNRINHERACHVVTIEDPIEFLHKNDKSVVSQREVAIDTEDFLSGLRSCLRQAPDVIQLGEMRDVETIKMAMTAAETGHLLIATLHTKGAVNSIDRIVDVFPADQQDQVRIQLSNVLHTVVSQQLIPRADGTGRVAAFEILHLNSAVKSMIRECKTHQIQNVIASGAAEGMITMDQSIINLYKSGIITADNALLYADNVEQVQRRLS